MICESEAENDIYQSATGVKTIAPFKPKWVDHVYSCDYVYPGGAKMTLSVKETSNEAATTAYFDSLATTLGKTAAPVGIPNAFQVKGGSVVVRNPKALKMRSCLCNEAVKNHFRTSSRL